MSLVPGSDPETVIMSLVPGSDPETVIMSLVPGSDPETVIILVLHDYILLSMSSILDFRGLYFCAA
jgi:hypothetical protein